MRVERAVLVALLLGAAVAVVLGGLSLGAPNSGSHQPSRRSRLSKMPELKDFAIFKRFYHKVYRRHTENMRRAKLYLKRAMHVFKNNIRYLQRKTTKYLKINLTSDWTDKERKSIFSAATTGRPSLDAAAAASLVRKGKRTFRMAGQRSRLTIRRLLLHLRAQMMRRRASPGRLRRPKKSRPERPGSSDLGPNQPAPREPHSEGPPEDTAGRGGDKQRGPTRSGDQVFLDYRDTGCLLMPKSQKLCGACYIFSATALFEYHHCKQTGELVSFSEQYAIDCGQRAQLKGCNGGIEDWAATFYAQFGLEIARRYPFVAQDQVCPYGRNSQQQSMGRIRADGAEIVSTDYEQLNGGPRQVQEWLETKGPLTIGIFSLHDFPDYGGGVDVIEGCDETGGHAMVVIGHGIEEGIEYWLIRNSHGHDWGLDGHYKLAKKSNPSCIIRVGYMETVPRFRVNKANDGRAVINKLHKDRLLEPQ